MKRKSSKQLFSVLMATAMVMSGISVPVMASPVDDAMVQSALAEAGVETSESRDQFQQRLEVPLWRCNRCRSKGLR